jgi:hypothetical protein
MRSITHSLTLFLLASALPLASAGDPIPLELKAQTGQRAEVEEESRSELKLHYRKAGEASVGGTEVNWSKRAYTEEVLRAKPLIQVREYKTSERWKGKPGAKAKPQQTSLHGRRIKLAGLEMEPTEAFEISKNDREQMRFDRLCRAFLPTAGQAAPKEKWKLPSDPFAKALWGKLVPPGAHHGGASVELKKVSKVSGRQVALLKVKLDFRTDLRESFPEITIKLKGTIRWDLDEHDLLAADLKGSFGYATVKDQVKVEAKGPFSYSYSARYLIPREVAKDAKASTKPPPPGATALVCTHDSRHRISLKEITCCPQCGETLDRERKCPKEHEWMLRHCFHDGAPLKHE